MFEIHDPWRQEIKKISQDLTYYFKVVRDALMQLEPVTVWKVIFAKLTGTHFKENPEG